MKSFCSILTVAALLLATTPISASAAPTPCSTALPAAEFQDCLLRALVTQDLELQHAVAARGLLEQRLQLRDEQLTILREDNTQLRNALKDTSAALQPTWWTSPWLWLGVGLLLGTGLTIGVGVAASNAWRR